MQLTRFNAYCPLEVGDRILDTAGQVHTITDIACIHYVRGGNVELRADHSAGPARKGAGRDPRGTNQPDRTVPATHIGTDSEKTAAGPTPK